MKRPAKKFALGTLAVSVIWILFEHLMGWNTDPDKQGTGEFARALTGYFFWIMIFVTIYYKRRGNGNTLLFMDGFKTGITMVLIYSLGFTIVILLYSKFLNPDLHNAVTTYLTNQLQQGALTQEKFDSKMKEVDMMYSGSALSYLLLFLFSSVIGIVIAAISSLILMKKPKPVQG